MNLVRFARDARIGFLQIMAFGLLLHFVLFSAQTAYAQAERGANPGDFDYYLLVMSWSPTYCETEGRGGYDQQCSGIRPYAFVLHGLWPQYEQRGWPEMCRIRERPWVPQELVDSMLDIMPSPRLVIHEYRTHGTCSGLLPRKYFEDARRLYQGIRIPDQFSKLDQPLSLPPEEIKSAFLAANPQLGPDMIEVGCSRDRLRDVKIASPRT